MTDLYEPLRPLPMVPQFVQPGLVWMNPNSAPPNEWCWVTTGQDVFLARLLTWMVPNKDGTSELGGAWSTGEASINVAHVLGWAPALRPSAPGWAPRMVANWEETRRATAAYVLARVEADKQDPDVTYWMSLHDAEPGYMGLHEVADQFYKRIAVKAVKRLMDTGSGNTVNMLLVEDTTFFPVLAGTCKVSHAALWRMVETHEPKVVGWTRFDQALTLERGHRFNVGTTLFMYEPKRLTP